MDQKICPRCDLISEKEQYICPYCFFHFMANPSSSKQSRDRVGKKRRGDEERESQKLSEEIREF
jgi:hypothetical protein